MVSSDRGMARGTCDQIVIANARALMPPNRYRGPPMTLAKGRTPSNEPRILRPTPGAGPRRIAPGGWWMVCATPSIVQTRYDSRCSRGGQTDRRAAEWRSGPDRHAPRPPTHWRSGPGLVPPIPPNGTEAPSRERLFLVGNLANIKNFGACCNLDTFLEFRLL
jgi:hypothetical protein